MGQYTCKGFLDVSASIMVHVISGVLNHIFDTRFTFPASLICYIFTYCMGAVTLSRRFMIVLGMPNNCWKLLNFPGEHPAERLQRGNRSSSSVTNLRLFEYLLLYASLHLFRIATTLCTQDFVLSLECCR